MYGKRLITKEDRTKVQQVRFDYLIGKGYARETYQGLNIFTKKCEEKRFEIEVFRNTASKSIAYNAYSSEEGMLEAVKRFKENYDRHVAWKANLKKDDKLKKEEAEKKAAAGQAPVASVKKTSYLVKKLLKEKFGIECTVRTDSFSGGNSINVDWVLGPDSDEVEALLGELQHGTFDSMTDCAGVRDTTPIIVDGFELTTFRFASFKQNIGKEFKFKLIQMYSNVFTVEGAPVVNTQEDTQTYFRFPDTSNNWDQRFYRDFKITNWVTQDAEKINLVKCVFDYEKQQVYFIYEVDGVQYNTQESTRRISKEAQAIIKPEWDAMKTFLDSGTGEATTTTITATVESGKVQIIEYSEKAIAVIGDTKPLKDMLGKNGLKGVFNKRLKCGAGWIFPKTRLEEVKAALTTKALPAAQPVETPTTESEEEVVDLFDDMEAAPAEVRAVFEKYEEAYTDGPTYQLNETVLAELKPLGYWFDYGLDAQPYNLQKL